MKEPTLEERTVKLLENIQTLLVWMAAVLTIGVGAWLALTFGR